MPGTDGTGGTSGCVTDTNTHTGSVVATDHPPFYSSDLCAVASSSGCCAPGEFADAANGNAWSVNEGGAPIQPQAPPVSAIAGIKSSPRTFPTSSLRNSTPCLAGTYQASATDAGNPVPCSACPAGTFQNSPGASACSKCPAGQLSRPDRTACGPCSAGEFADTELQTCVACPAGKYAPQALENDCLTWYDVPNR